MLGKATRYLTSRLQLAGSPENQTEILRSWFIRFLLILSILVFGFESIDVALRYGYIHSGPWFFVACIGILSSLFWIKTRYFNLFGFWFILLTGTFLSILFALEVGTKGISLIYLPLFVMMVVFVKGWKKAAIYLTLLVGVLISEYYGYLQQIMPILDSGAAQSRSNLTILFNHIIVLFLFFLIASGDQIIRFIQNNIYLENQKNEAQHRQRLALSTLAGGAAHEINNPLAVILASLELMKVKEEVISERGIRRLNTMISHCNRIKSIVENIRVISGDIDCSILSIIDNGDIQKICLQSITDLADRLSLSDTSFVQIDISHQFSCYAHLSYIKVMLDHLIDNAYHAANKNERACIRISSRQDPLDSAIIIEDNGVNNIDPSLFDALFDPFFTTKEIGSGQGLGLAICSAICIKLGWKIRMRRLDQRTQIIIAIPHYTTIGDAHKKTA